MLGSPHLSSPRPAREERSPMSTAAIQLSPESFTRDFSSLSPFILEEWPDLDADTLAKTEGDPDEVVRYVAEATDHSRTLVRKHLAEIQKVHGEAGGIGVAQVLSRMEARLEALSGTIKDDMVPRARERAEQLRDEATERAERLREEAAERAAIAKEQATAAKEAVEEKARENILTSLLIALGFGFLLGLLMGTRGR
ncbi:MAG: DUF883 family protein [Alphaproteobacteria bacterium]|nr:DUF883 family protein [Alphaproteobacteria bacterium]